MYTIIQEFDHLKVQMKDILSATNNFDRNELIGRGGFGPVYKGRLSLLTGPTMVAFKRLDPRLGQGNTEFWREIFMLSSYKHNNLVSLLHFSIEGEERVLVYEYASRGSLDQHLSDGTLTWKQRLHICIGAARALRYLHDPGQTQQRVLHRDIKSANILLDEEWNAKVSDFGLSKIGPANQPQTFLISNAVGTPGYCDPLYWEMGFLSKESDVYSFGVVLFEVLCGRLCCQYRNRELIGMLVPRWKNSYAEDKLDDIILEDLKEQIDRESLITFSTIANQCLNRDRTERPTMDKIVKELELALQQMIPNYRNMVEISKLAVRPLSYRSHDELISLLSKGILVDKGKGWISVDKNGQIYEMISATQCIYEWSFNCCIHEASRFSYIVAKDTFNFRIEARARFLLPHITYTINLIFKHRSLHDIYVPFLYKLEEETNYLTPRVAYRRDDAWIVAELYQFSSNHKEHDFKLEFLPYGWHAMENWDFEGIEFQPMEHVIHENLEDKQEADVEEISNLDANWEQKLSVNPIALINLSKDNIKWTTKKELYFLLRKGLRIYDGEFASSYSWLSISKNLKIHLMMPVTVDCSHDKWTVPKSRFRQVAQTFDRSSYRISCHVKKSELLSPTYSAHLIYRLTEYYPWSEDCILSHDSRAYVYASAFFLVPRLPTPSIRSMVHPIYDIPLHSHNIISHPKLRKDGWMELSLFNEDKGNSKDIFFVFTIIRKMKDLVIHGIELRSL